MPEDLQLSNKKVLEMMKQNEDLAKKSPIKLKSPVSDLENKKKERVDRIGRPIPRMYKLDPMFEENLPSNKLTLEDGPKAQSV